MFIKCLKLRLDFLEKICYNIFRKWAGSPERGLHMENTYIDFLFEDLDSGEQFFVEIKLEANGSYEEARKKAIAIANENFDNAEIQPGWLPAYEAEVWGLDTY